ncbi:phosphomannomutase/phosphoglucomutase [Candidatus Daviesbacteria bacterium]|nr:phosphomannomutase/phosphoglucomutase [Candidatus Daviesbacteria bacterium]
MKVDESIFKSYDIRGVYPTQLNEQVLPVIISSIYSFFQSKLGEKQLSIALGRDMRLSSPSLFKIASKTLVDLGADVVDIGLVATTTFYFAVHKYRYDGGIQISASHNPKEYNGLKIVMKAEKGLIKIGKSTGMEEIKKSALEANSEKRKAKNGKVVKKKNMVREEVKNAFKIAGEGKVKKFKIIADTANAMGATYIQELFKKIPCELVKMNFKLDGTFPAHQPDPLQLETLKDLQQRVVEEKADLGLAPDGDGDRIFFIDEKGEIIPPSVITAIVAKELLKNNKGEKILFDIRYILTPKRVTEEHGGIPVVTKVGHAFITEAMQKEDGLFAGESSGHYYFRTTGGAESSVSVILILLNVLSREDIKFSELVKRFTRSRESGEINFKVKNAPEIIEVLKDKFSDGMVSELDGVAVEYPEWRFSLRTSNTEPLLRLNVEEELIAAKGRHAELVDIIKKNAISE